MAKVKDTATFIEAARAVHGDKYDYSQSVWTRANSPILYKCNKCGKDTQTYAARKHICEKEKQGCGRCYRKKICDKKDAWDLKNRPCVYCGNPVGSTDSNRVACSRKCGYSARSLGKVLLPCLVCGKEVERYKRQSDQSKGACCSLACQRQFALVENHSRFSQSHCEGRSRKAKQKWQELGSKKRKSKSIMYAYWLKCKIPSELNVSKWNRRCTSSAAGLKDRFVGEVRLRKVVKTWKLCFSVNFSRLKQKVLRNERIGWEWKVESVASGLRRRRKVKSLQQGKKSILRHIELQAQRPKQLSFWG